MASGPAKCVIHIESSVEQQENLKNHRKTLHTLQQTASDKENLVGRVPAFIGKEHLIKQSMVIDTTEIKRKKLITQSCQTSPEPKVSKEITENDLTTEDAPSERYWEILAEKRRDALEESLIENEELHGKIAALTDELNTSRKMLEETRSLVEVLTEMLQENEEEEDGVNASVAEEADEV